MHRGERFNRLTPPASLVTAVVNATAMVLSALLMERLGNTTLVGLIAGGLLYTPGTFFMPKTTAASMPMAFGTVCLGRQRMPFCDCAVLR